MLDKIIEFSIKNKFIVGLFTLALVLVGIYNLSRLPIDALPDITNNQVQVITTAPTLATQEVEQFITYPIEQTMKTIPKIVEMRSISRFGLSVITLVFEENVDIYWARQQMSEKLKDAERLIPNGTGIPELAPSVLVWVKSINTLFSLKKALKISMMRLNFVVFKIG
jgi:cobalt-zinc-cadmium resistance protein CzcA